VEDPQKLIKQYQLYTRNSALTYLGQKILPLVRD